MRTMIKLDHSWSFAKGDDPSWLKSDFSPEGWTSVSLPATNLELPWNGFDEKSYQFVSTWLRDFEMPSALEPGSRAFVDFEGVMAAARVFVNGEPVGAHEGGYTPFSLEIGRALRPGKNRLAVQVDSRELAGIPPFGHVIDYLCYGGIYREAFIRVQDAALISDLFARPEGALEARKGLRAEIAVDRGPNSAEGLEIRLELRGVEGASPIASANSPLSPEGPTVVVLEDLDGIEIWEPSRPRLYDIVATLFKNGEAIDVLSSRIGWREAVWTPEGFYLNGRPLKIRGLNRHQAWPVMGYAMPERAQRRDAEILKNELGVNLVRSSHYPPSRHFLDACDELGLLVFEELPGWQHVGDAAWKDRAVNSLEEMILRDRNHPSIVLWGARINESQDDHDFYKRTNETAHRLDPTRQTGGVRYLEKSELLEDVYTFNDFVHSGGKTVLRRPRAVTGLGRDVPYLITEHNGHMFPTKRFDQEERLAEHALRHARVLDEAYGNPYIAGAIGWVAFDYNTHKDFGSGDRVCYHGLSDMFRIPKYAAAVYASQVDPSERIVLEAASLFAKGERSAAFLLPIEIWTNCDEIVLWRGGERVGSYLPDRASFPNLPHPPIVIRDLIGDRLQGLGFSPGQERLIREIASVVFSKGFAALGWRQLARMGLMLLLRRMSFADAEKLVSRYALGWGASDESFELVGLLRGEEVARRRYSGDAHAVRLEIKPDDDRLISDGIDVTRIVLRLLDQYDNIHPFGAEAVELSIEGQGSIIGPTLIPLVGGVAAFWVRSSREAGSIVVGARGSRFGRMAAEITTSAPGS